MDVARTLKLKRPLPFGRDRNVIYLIANKSGIASAELKKVSFCARLSLTFCNEADTEAEIAVTGVVRVDIAVIEPHAERSFFEQCT